jgi:hypothetical protein
MVQEVQRQRCAIDITSSQTPKTHLARLGKSSIDAGNRAVGNGSSGW